jgi:hypothetical protein
MRHVKSERLKKLESELNDLEQWLKLGLVPKKDIEKHREEIEAVRGKIEEEKERLQFLKESGEVEEYVTPKRGATRTSYTDMPSIPDVDMADTGVGLSETQFDLETDAGGSESSVISERDDEDAVEEDDGAERDEDDTEMEDDESYFSDRNRWRRGGIVDPDADEW